MDNKCSSFFPMKKLLQCHKHLHAICESVFRFQWATHPSINVQVLKNCKNVHFALMKKVTPAVNCYCWSLQEIVLARWMQCFYEVSGIALKNPVIRQDRHHTVSMHLNEIKSSGILKNFIPSGENQLKPSRTSKTQQWAGKLFCRKKPGADLDSRGRSSAVANWGAKKYRNWRKGGNEIDRYIDR